MNGAVLFNLGLVILNLALYTNTNHVAQLIAAAVCLAMAAMCWK